MKCQNCGTELKEGAKFCPRCGTKTEQVQIPKNTAYSHDITAVWPEWKIEKQLGKGSYGVVYQAMRNDNNVESHAAIKVISIPTDASEVDSLRSEGMDANSTRAYFKGVVDEFVREIQLMESLKGIQNIVSVEDYKVIEHKDDIGWDIYIRMELLTPFNTYICDKTLTEQDVIKLGMDICTALEICSKRNIIHRDIKPENIFINDFGYYKLGDFGIARELENATGGLSQKGTFNYMAPEVANSGNYDARVDIYSLGIVLYRFLNNNKLPFLDQNKPLITPNERKAAVERRIRGEALPAPCNASAEMADVVLRACAFDPDARFSSAEEMKKALVSVTNGSYVVSGDNIDGTVKVIPANKKSNTAVTAGKTADETNVTTAVRKSSADNSNQKTDADGKKTKKDKKKDKKNNKNGSEKKKKPVVAVILIVILLLVVAIAVIPKLLNNDSSDEANAKTDAETVKKNESSSGENKEDKEIAAIVSEAEGLGAAEDYESALECIENGLETYPDSEKLQEKLEEYTDALNEQIKAENLEEAQELAESGDYMAAMQLIEGVEDYTDDDDYKNAYDEYKSLYEADVIAEALKNAEHYVEQKDYLNAYNVIEQAIKTVGENEELTAKAEEYGAAYVKEISAQVDTLVGKNDISGAKQLLQDAQKEFPNNETLNDRLNELNRYNSVRLDTLSPINGGFNWNEGDAADPFGNSYEGVKNYTILHEDNHYKSSTYSAEYNIDGKYDNLTFTISPYSDFGQNCKAYIQIFGDDTLRYTSPYVVQKSQPRTVSVDISNATYIKIIVYIGADSGCIMLSDVMLSGIPNYVSTYTGEYTSLSTLDVFNGGISWFNGYPVNTQGDDYSNVTNYSILHEDNHYKSSTYSVEYYVNKQYSSLNFNIAPTADFGASCESCVKIYLDDVLVYTSPKITQKTALFNTGNIDISKTTYLKIVIEIGSDSGCLIISDALLKNK